MSTDKIIKKLNPNAIKRYIKRVSKPFPPIKNNPKEPYIIMGFNPSNSQQSQVFTDMDKHPEVLKWMGGHTSSPEEIDSLIRSLTSDRKKPRLIYAIATRDLRVVGWVKYYPDKKSRIKKIRGQIAIPDNALVLETGYLKRFPRNIEGTSNHKGVAVSGLKQTLGIIADLEQRTADITRESPRPIIVTAYTNPGNSASEAVLIANGFQILPDKIDYDGELHYVWIKKIN